MGSDQRLGAGASPRRSFYPRSRMGSDGRRLRAHVRGLRFYPRSRMGSDPRGDADRCRRLGFYPRSRMGSDRLACQTEPVPKQFLSTLPHGERPLAENQDLRRQRFYPRSRMGSDKAVEAAAKAIREFLSTLPHGERLGDAYGGGSIKQFLSTLPHGERRHCSSGIAPEARFYPRSRMGSDVAVERLAALGLGVSIHAPAWGATCHRLPVTSRSPGFYPRSRVDEA